MLEEIIEELKDLLVNQWNTNINNFSTAELTLDLVDVNNIKPFDFDLERNKRNVMLFILPENDVFERLSLNSNDVETEITFYIICRNDTRENLFKKVLRYTSSLYEFIKEQNNLSGKVGDMQILTSEYFHAVESNEDIKGSEVVVKINYEN